MEIVLCYNIEYQDIQGKIIYTPSIVPIISQNRLIEFIQEYIYKIERL